MKRILIGLFLTVAVAWGQGAEDFSPRKPAPIAYASLSSGLAAGEIAYCTDCTAGTDPCTGSGSGSFVWKDSGGSHCGAAGGGGSSVFAKSIWIPAAGRNNTGAIATNYQGMVVEIGVLDSSVPSVEMTNSGSDAFRLELYLYDTWDGTQPTLKVGFVPENLFPSNGTVLFTASVHCSSLTDEWFGTPTYTAGTQATVTLSNGGGKRHAITLTIPTTAGLCEAGDFMMVEVKRDAGAFTGKVHSPGSLFTEVY